MRLRQPLRRLVDQLLDARVGELRQPAHQRDEGVGAQLLEELAQFLLRGMDRRLVERLQQLRQRLRLRQPGRQALERLAVLGDELARPLQDVAGLAQHERHGAEVARAEEVGDEVLDDGDQLGADRAVRLQLEEIE